MTPIATTNTSICETSAMFTGGGPGDQGALVEINGYQFIPSPFVNINLEKYKMGNIVIGGIMKITLNGVVTGNSFSDVASELQSIFGGTIGANSDCVNVIIQCANTFINGYGRVTAVNISEGQQPTWVNLAPYSIEIELYENDGVAVVLPDTSVAGFGQLALSNFEESLTLTIDEESFNWSTLIDPPPSVDGIGNRHVKLNFSIKAAGINGCNDGDLTYGLEAAESIIEDRIESLKSGNLDALNNISQTVNLNTDISAYLGNRYLELRNVSVDTMNNSISVEGSMIYRSASCAFPDVFTTLNISENIDTEGSVVTIAGTINGLYDMNYSNIISDTNNDVTTCSFNEKMLAADSFLSVIANDEVLKNLAFGNSSGRSHIVDACISTGNSPCGSISPNTSPDLCDFRLITSQLDRKFAEGSIDFSFQLSNKNNCSIPGVSKLDVEITHDRPHDNIVEILIPGRGDDGVLIQNLCCKSPYKISINLNAALDTSTCNLTGLKIDTIRTCASGILEDLKSDLDTTCWFVTSDQETTGNNSYRLSQELVKPNNLP